MLLPPTHTRNPKEKSQCSFLALQHKKGLSARAYITTTTTTIINVAKKQGERGHFRLLSEIKWGVEIRQSGSDICLKLDMQCDTWWWQQNKMGKARRIKLQNKIMDYSIATPSIPTLLICIEQNFHNEICKHQNGRS